ncbi:MAG: putative polysaccharide biosynthesis protein [Microbacterium sp.]|jgi:PST family polysaccharide transporter|nr:putative polysaccharide biosynthesis protein [Microbacterium sp.]
MTRADDIFGGRSLGRAATRGAATVLAGQLVRLLVQLASTAVLSRLLSPDDFGLFAVVLSVVALGELLRDFGLTTAASRATNLTRGSATTLLIINSALGLALMVAAFFSAPLIAAVFGQPSLLPLVQLLSVTLFVNGLAAQFRAEINRRLAFGRLALVDAVPALLGLAAAIAWALASPTAFALAAQQLAVAVCGLILAVALAGWMPGRPAPLREVRPFLTFGLNLFSTQLLAYGAKNVDNYLLAAFWGPSVLGIYSRAFQLLMLPLNQLTAPLTRVSVPLLTRAHESGRAIFPLLIRAQTLSLLILGSLYAYTIGAAPYLVPTVFGPGWGDMVPVFQLLAAGGIFKVLNQVLFWGFLAVGRTASQLGLYAVTQPLIVVAIVCGVPFGAEGVALGHSIGYFISWMIGVVWFSSRVHDGARLFANAAWVVAVVAPAAAGVGVLWQMIEMPHAFVSVLSVLSFALAMLMLVAAVPRFRQIALGLTGRQRRGRGFVGEGNGDAL